MEDYIDVNRKTWDQKVGVHVEQSSITSAFSGEQPEKN